jgi:hypothetical protein
MYLLRLRLVLVLSLLGSYGLGWGALVNGGFEAGDLTGWSLGSQNPFAGVQGGVVHAGSFAARLGTLGSGNTLNQSISTVAGTFYDIEFWLKNPKGGASTSFSASWGGTELVAVVNSGTFDWTKYTFTQEAVSGTTQLLFSFRHDPDYFYLDDVSVTPVPEPVSYALAIFGLAGLGGVGLRSLRSRRLLRFPN